MPDCRGGARYLWWLVGRQGARSAAGALIASVWMVLLAATPYLMSRAVDEGVQTGDTGALAGWCAALVAFGGLSALLGVMRHRTMTRVRMDANFRTVKVVVGHAVRLGAALSRQVGAGEVVTIGVGDVQTISQALTAVGPGVGSVVAYLTVAVLLVPVSPLIAALVLLGIPVIVLLVGPLLGRLQGAETEYRERQGVLTERIGDLAGGLRVLNALGGKGLVGDAFRADSLRLREQGYRVGSVTSWVQALGVGLPTLFLAVVTWPAARLAARGEISVGELVSVYGYVAVLVGPVSFWVECGYQISRGLVAARRVVRFLRLEPPADSGTSDAPAGPSVLHDPESGVRVLPGRLTALACAHPADAAAVLDRLGRYVPSDATWGGLRLDEIALHDVRERILVADHEADLFAGPLRELVGGRWGPQGRAEDAGRWGAEDPCGTTDRAASTGPGGTTGRPASTGPGGSTNRRQPTDLDGDAGRWGAEDPGGTTDRAASTGPGVSTGRRWPADLDGDAGRPGPGGRGEDALRWALHAAAADDIILGLPEGLDSVVDAQGRSLSGGQRQRVRLARALHADPEVLLAVEPTSALDAHTEATVADRLRAARAGRTTVLTTTSPLVLARADTVTYLHGGRVVATGAHHDLLDREPGYRALVARDADGADRADGADGTDGTDGERVPGPAGPDGERVPGPGGEWVAGPAGEQVTEGPVR
ncbi:ABC transporter transmembrane domain-containing protein [Streptomyces sp. NPDC005925]|uniref:ABC transporter transmembrane domain-containing protein n=1 Tax=Streptomyces sp. NPDC005925 TaxID=3157172 RepID=UPI0033EBB662